MSRGHGTKSPGYRPMRVPHATIPSSLGPARKHTTKFEPDSWRWAQMTSGFGPPKRILSDGPCSFKLKRQNAVPRSPIQAVKGVAGQESTHPKGVCDRIPSWAGNPNWHLNTLSQHLRHRAFTSKHSVITSVTSGEHWMKCICV